MSETLPFYRLFTKDWLHSTRALSAAGKGVLIDVVCLAADCDRRGFLHTDGRPWTQADILKRLTGDPKTNQQALKEVIDEKYLIEQDGVLNYPPMVKDAQLTAVRAEAGSKGGAAKQTPSKPPSKLQANPQAMLRAFVEGKSPSNFEQTNEQTNEQSTSKTEAAPSRAQSSEFRNQNEENRAVADSPIAADDDLTDEQKIRAVYIQAAGIGQPTLNELAKLPLTPHELQKVIKEGQAAKKGPGAIVLNIRAAAEQGTARAAATQEDRELDSKFKAALKRCNSPMSRVRAHFLSEHPHMKEYTGGLLEDLPKFKQWFVKGMEGADA